MPFGYVGDFFKASKHNPSFIYWVCMKIQKNLKSISKRDERNLNSTNVLIHLLTSPNNPSMWVFKKKTNKLMNK